MEEDRKGIRPVEGQTYTLLGRNSSTERYYSTIQSLLRKLLQHIPDERQLLASLRKAGGYRSKQRSDIEMDSAIHDNIAREIHTQLSAYTANTSKHLDSMSVRQRFDPIIRTKEHQYHLYMIEIELVNRIYIQNFKKSPWKFALIAHCLRDFRPGCKAAAGDIERVCKDCTQDCFIHLGGMLMRKYGIHPYISTTIDMEQLFRRLKNEHTEIGALGIACVPELVHGMRLCLELGIYPVGIPLDANRCARWTTEKTRESSFALDELEALIR